MNTVTKVVLLFNMLFVLGMLIEDIVKSFKHIGQRDTGNQISILIALSVSQLLILIDLFV